MLNMKLFAKVTILDISTNQLDNRLKTVPPSQNSQPVDPLKPDLKH